MEIEREAIKREGDKEKVEDSSNQIAELNQERNSLKARWEQEKELVNNIQQYKNDIENFKFQALQEEKRQLRQSCRNTLRKNKRIRNGYRNYY